MRARRAAPGSACRSRGRSSSSTEAASGSTATRAGGPRSGLRSRRRVRHRPMGRANWMRPPAVLPDQVLRILVIAAAALLLAAAPAAAAPWSQPAPVSVGPDASTPAVAVAADGSDVLAVVDDNGVDAAVRGPGEASFGPAQVVAPPPAP